MLPCKHPYPRLGHEFHNLWFVVFVVCFLVVGDMAVGHIAGLAFGGLQPHSASEHVVEPNVLIIHNVKVWIYVYT